MQFDVTRLDSAPRWLGVWSVWMVGIVLLVGGSLPASDAATRGTLRIGVFQVDATPPLGSPVAYAPARSIEDPLSARGIVLVGAGPPIVLCAVDWIGIGNGGHDVWRDSLAQAAGTTRDRVAVHALHQHDGVRCDFTAEELLAAQGLGGRRFDVAFARQTIENTARAVRESLENLQPVSHLGVGKAKVEKVASNRRILGPDGRVTISRSSSYRIPEPLLSRLSVAARANGYELSAARVEEALAAPEGVIDPWLKMLTFFVQDRPIVSLSYYSTHPQSHFGKGDVTSEFVGLARAEREQALGGMTLVHFNGAGGNVAAGKYNDGTPEARVMLTERMAEGMRRAWEATEKVPLSADEVDWRVEPVRLPVAAHLDPGQLRATLEDPAADEGERLAAAGKLAFVLRMTHGDPIELACLQLGNVHILHMPGELFVEYQLAARRMKPDAVVCMAAYGDYAAGYIGTEIAYSQGGYETQPSASNVSPEVERVLMNGMRRLLHPVRRASSPRVRVTFAAMGDVPYAPEEDVLLPRQIEELPMEAAFVVHLGDIKTGRSPCDETVYAKVAGMLARSRAPLFIIPGDNEWNDCPDPEDAWRLWEKYFQRFDERWTNRPAVFRQLEREENFSFVQGGVLFLGLNLVGGRVQDEAEWRRRHAENLDWMQRNLRRFGSHVSAMIVFGHANPQRRHDDFFGLFVEEARAFEKPILYLHGDGHRWIHDRPFDARNILRVQVDQGGSAPPILIRVSDDPEEPFVFDRRRDAP